MIVESATIAVVTYAITRYAGMTVRARHSRGKSGKQARDSPRAEKRFTKTYTNHSPLAIRN